MMQKEKYELFVDAIVGDNNKIKTFDELQLVTALQDKFLHLLITDDIRELKNRCRGVVREIMGNEPLKGNITYSVETNEDDSLNVDIVRNAHGGGNNALKRKNGGVAIIVIKTVAVKGTLSPIHGITLYHPEENDPFAGILENM